MSSTRSACSGGAPQPSVVLAPRATTARSFPSATRRTSATSSADVGAATSAAGTPATSSSGPASRVRAAFASSWATPSRRPPCPISEHLRQTGFLQRVRALVPARHLAAQPRGREDLAGVGQVRRVERAAQRLHGVEVVVGEHPRHVLRLVHADAVLAGDGPAVLDAEVEDRGGHLFGLLGLPVHPV